MNSFLEYTTYKIKLNLPTTLKRIIATASLTIPYPKMTENNLGCYWGLIKVNAATESVALIVALNLIINAVDNITVYVLPIT